MTSDEAIRKLEALTDGDREVAHGTADYILVRLLQHNGFADVADAFEKARERVGFWRSPMKPEDVQNDAIIALLSAELEKPRPVVKAALTKAQRDGDQIREQTIEEVSAAPELLIAAEMAYTILGDIRHQWPGRQTLEGQRALCALHAAICKATGRDAQEVQDDFCNRGWLFKHQPKL